MSIFIRTVGFLVQGLSFTVGSSLVATVSNTNLLRRRTFTLVLDLSSMFTLSLTIPAPHSCEALYLRDKRGNSLSDRPHKILKISVLNILTQICPNWPLGGALGLTCTNWSQRSTIEPSGPNWLQGALQGQSAQLCNQWALEGQVAQIGHQGALQTQVAQIGYQGVLQALVSEYTHF